MALDYEYGINIGNRFFDLAGHDEDPDEFIANQSNLEEKPKQSTKEAKTTTKKSSSKKSPVADATATTTPSTTTAVTATVPVTKLNKENVTPKSADTEKQQLRSKPDTDNDAQKEQLTRIDSSRGGRSFRRGGASSGRGRPPYEGNNRGSGQQRSERINKYRAQIPRNDANDFETSTNTWSNEAEGDSQQPRNHYFRGRGRGSGRGRSRGGRGYFHSRPQEITSQDQQPPNSSGFEQTVESNFDNVQPESSTQPLHQDFEVDVTTSQEQFTQADGGHRGRGRGRGRYGPRVFRNSRNYPTDRENQREDYQHHYRQNRRHYDRESHSFNSTMKPVEKSDAEGANNTTHSVENPENVEPRVDVAEVVDQPSEEAPAAVPKDWAQQMDEAEEMMTYDEYKKKKEAEKQAQQEKIVPLRKREANDGAVVKEWQDPNLRYHKKYEANVSGDDQKHEDSDKEIVEGEEETMEDSAGKRKLINIPLRFNRFDRPRGFGDSRGGRRHDGSGRFRDQQRPRSPNQQVPSSEQAGEYYNDQQQTRPYRGRPRQGYGRGEFRRAYNNSARGSRQGYTRSVVNPNTPDFANTNDFPTLNTTKP